MKKQLTALAIVLCLLLTLLAGCSSGNGSSAGTTDNTEAPTSAPAPAEDGSETVSEPESGDDSAETASYFPLAEDDGHILRFFMLYSGSGYTDFGPAIRQDWLDALGMDAPVTYDQWYDTISAFNTEYGATLAIPATATVSYGFLCSAYDLELPTSDGGANDGFYVVDGEVHYGPYEENLYDYLNTLHTWYEEGLINPNFMTSQNGAQTDTDLITNNTCGIFFMSYNRFTEYEEQMESGTSIQAISDALLTEDQTTHIRPLTEPVGNIVISSTCENVELAVRFMNWWYTEEGIELANYGVEGLSFNYGGDGSIVWTELVSDNDTLSLDAALAMYTGSRDSITYYYDSDKFDTLYDERQINAGKLWRSTDDGAYAMPSSFDYGCDKEAQDLMTDILTYVNENIVQFVIGSRSLDEFDDYIAQLKDMGIEDVLAIYTNEYAEKYA